MNNTLKLIIAVAIPLIVGGVSGYFTSSGVDSWYQTINKPSWNPPDWVFAPVWTTLYIFMGIALFLVWKADAPGKMKKNAIGLFAAQLLLNFLWSLIFFSLQQPAWAFAEIMVLWVLILLTIFAFGKINKIAAWLLVPYICWVSFASVLTYFIWQLNG